MARYLASLNSVLRSGSVADMAVAGTITSSPLPGSAAAARAATGEEEELKGAMHDDSAGQQAAQQQQEAAQEGASSRERDLTLQQVDGVLAQAPLLRMLCSMG